MVRVVTIVSAFLLLFACVSSTSDNSSLDTTDAPVQVSDSTESTINSIKQNIITGTPSSLIKAYTDTRLLDAGAADSRIEYQYVAWKVLEILYPEKSTDLVKINPPADSLFLKLFLDIEAGNISEIEAENSDYLTLLLSALVLLYAENENVISDAQENLDLVYSLDPLSNSVLPALIRGKFYERVSDFSQAEKFYEDTLFRDTSIYPARMGLYRIYIKQGELEKAEDLENELQHDLADNENFLYYKALRLMNSGNGDESFILTEQLMEKDSSNYNYIFLRVRQNFFRENYQQVESSLIGLSEEPGQKEILYYLVFSKVNRKLDQNDEAVEIISEGLVIYPESEEVKYEQALAFAAAGDVTLIKDLQDAGNTTLDGTEFILYKAIDDEEWATADTLIVELLKIERKDEYLHLAAQIYMELGSGAEALNYIEELYEKTNDDELLPLYIRILLLVLDDEKVIKLIDSKLETVKDGKVKSQLYVFKSRFTFKRKDKLKYLKLATFEDLGNIEAHILLAQFYEEIGDVETALKNLRTAELIDPDNQEVQEKIRKLIE